MRAKQSRFQSFRQGAEWNFCLSARWWLRIRRDDRAGTTHRRRLLFAHRDLERAPSSFRSRDLRRSATAEFPRPFRPGSNGTRGATLPARTSLLRFRLRSTAHLPGSRPLRGARRLRGRHSSTGSRRASRACAPTNQHRPDDDGYCASLHG